jgi:Peptidase family M28
VLSSLGLLYFTGALMPYAGHARFEAGWPWLASLFPATYVAGMVVTLLKDDQTEFSRGAHDNAASVAVALEIGRRIAAEPLEGTELWLAFTGAEETDHAGLYALLEKHQDVLQHAAFIGLEGLGSGDLVYLTRQGLCSRYRPHPDLLAAASKTAARLPELCARPAEMIGEDETGTLRRTGYRAICIAGRDPLSGTLPHWHRADDTFDTVSAAFMEHAASFVMGVLRDLDSIGRSVADGRHVGPS